MMPSLMTCGCALIKVRLSTNIVMAILANFIPSLCGHETLVIVPALIICTVLFYQVFFAIKYPANLPLVGEPDGKRWFSLGTKWRYYTDCDSLYTEAYEQVCEVTVT